MHTSLRLSGRYALNAMNAALIFQRAIDVGTADSEVNLLESAYSTFADAGDAELPTFGIAEALVHLEQVACKQRSLVTARSCADFHLHVLGVLGVLRDEGNLDFLFQFRLKSFVVSQLLTSHLLHLRVALVSQNVFCLFDAVQTGDVTLTGIHDVTQILILLGQFHKAVLVGNHIGVGNQC